MLSNKVNLSLQEDIDTEGSNDAEDEAPEVTLEAPDASEVNHASVLFNYRTPLRSTNTVTSRFLYK